MFPENDLIAQYGINPGGTANFETLAKLNEALRAARTASQRRFQKGGIGYQTPSTPSSEEFSALVPQSIEDMYSVATYMEEDITFTKDLTRIDVTQNVHQWNSLTDYSVGGPGASGFAADGGLPAESASVFAQGSVTIKYLMEYRTVTDVAATVGLLGPNPNAVAAQLNLAQTSLIGRNEWSLLHADSDVTPYGYDGVLKQIRDYNNGSNVTDNNGAVLTLDQLSNTIGRIMSTNAFAKPNVVYVDPASFTPLAVEAATFSRYMADTKSPGYTHGIDPTSFYFMGPRGRVMVRMCPFIDFSIWPWENKSRGDSPPSKPTLTSVTTPVNAASRLAAGDYRYSLIAISRNGNQSVPTLSADIAAVTVASGDSVNLLLDDAAAKAAADPVTGYILYRGSLDGDFTTLKEVARVPVNTDGGSGKTLIIDLGLSVYNTGKALITRQDPRELCFHQLLDTFMRPLASIYTSHRFALMRFGTPTVKLPQRSWVIDNVGKPSFGP